MEFEIKEIRKGHFVKILNGQVVGTANAIEVDTYYTQREGPNIDPALIEISLALAGILGFFQTLEIGAGLSLLVKISFLFSIVSTYSLLALYIFFRVPLYSSRVRRNLNKFSGPYLIYGILYSLSMMTYVFYFGLRLFLSAWDSSVENTENIILIKECAYILLFLAVNFTMAIVIVSNFLR